MTFRLLRRLLRREKPPTYIRIEDYVPPKADDPVGVRVREYAPPADVFWSSWPAWRFAQGSPEYFEVRDPTQRSHRAVVNAAGRWPSCAGFAGYIDSVHLPATRRR